MTEKGDGFDIARAREDLRMLVHATIAELPPYWKCVAVACRVGATISAHTRPAHPYASNNRSVARAIEYATLDTI